MKIAYLTDGDPKKDANIQLIRESAEKEKIDVVFLHPNMFLIELPGKISLKEGKFDFEVILSRIGYVRETEFDRVHGELVLYYLSEKYPDKVINRFRGYKICQDKFTQLQLAAEIGCPIPKTLLLGNPKQIDQVLSKFKQEKYIIKNIRGYGGQHIVLSESQRSARSILERLLELDQSVLVQEYIQEARGEDYRLLVVGNQIASAVKRKATKADEFRSNLSAGGRLERFYPDKSLTALAIKLVKEFDLDIAGVDFIKRGNQYIFIEMNASPGLATRRPDGSLYILNIDLVKKIFDLCRKRAGFKK